MPKSSQHAPCPPQAAPSVWQQTFDAPSCRRQRRSAHPVLVLVLVVVVTLVSEVVVVLVVTLVTKVLVIVVKVVVVVVTMVVVVVLVLRVTLVVAVLLVEVHQGLVVRSPVVIVVVVEVHQGLVVRSPVVIVVVVVVTVVVTLRDDACKVSPACALAAVVFFLLPGLHTSHVVEPMSILAPPRSRIWMFLAYTCDHVLVTKSVITM
jgi:hypothetical protein